MALITWQDEYSLGIEEIDNQHQKIVVIINSLYEIYSKKAENGLPDLNPTFKELADYADYHFTTEENYFQAFKYEQTAGHVEMHNKYRTKIAEFVQQYNENKDEAVFFNLTNFLQEWWVWHINNMDREYVELFKTNGLK